MKIDAYKKKTALLLVIGISSVAAISGMVHSHAEDASEDRESPLKSKDGTPGNEVLNIEGKLANASLIHERRKNIKKKQVTLAARKRGQSSEKKVDQLHPLDDLSEHEAIEVLATGYTAGVESTGKTKEHPSYGITRSGIRVHRGIYSTIAADPEVFPIGSVLYIPDYGYGVVADTGSAIKGNRVDLYFETVEQVYDNWGKRKIKVYVMEKGDGELTQQQFDQYNQTAEQHRSALQ